MATNITTFDEFRELVAKNGEIASEAVLARAPLQLKRELLQAFKLLDGLTGNIVEWNESKAYVVDDMVKFKKNVYICIKDNTNKRPDAEPTFWRQLTSSGGVISELFEMTYEANNHNNISPFNTIQNAKFEAGIEMLFINGVLIPNDLYSVMGDTITLNNTAVYHGDIIKVALK